MIQLKLQAIYPRNRRPVLEGLRDIPTLRNILLFCTSVTLICRLFFVLSRLSRSYETYSNSEPRTLHFVYTV